jgi:excinuclease ABC subunit B
MARRLKELEKQMYEHARNLEFEEAARVRDRIRELQGKGLAA